MLYNKVSKNVSLDSILRRSVHHDVKKTFPFYLYDYEYFMWYC